MPDILGKIRKRRKSNGQAMHGGKKELGFKLFKMVCQKERDTWDVQGKYGKIR